MRAFFRYISALVILVGGIFVLQPTTVYAAVACSASAAAQNGIYVAPSHGNVFYIDTGVSPRLDSGYIGYRVTNRTGSTQGSLWAQVSNFSGSVVSLVNVDDTNMQLSSIVNNATTTAYWMLKATGATASTQTHTLKIYDKRPDLSGANVLYTCDFTFASVRETIKAAANKLADNGFGSAGAAIDVSNTSPKLGELITVTVEGQTGQIGQGASPDFDIIWMTPSAVSSWPTRSLRLESMSVTFDGNNNWSNTGDEVTYNDQLLISSTNGLTNVDNSGYRITYRYRVIGAPQSTVKIVPVSMISSGTQIKHTDTTATGGTLDISFAALTVNSALTKSVTTTTGLTVVTCSGTCSVPGGIDGETYVAVPYRLTATTTSATSLTIDEMVDTPASGIIFKTNSASTTDLTRSGVGITDPVYLTSEAALNPRPVHFVGPFTFSSAKNAVVDYTMWVPVGTYANTAYAQVGDIQIGATASAKQLVTITSTGSSSVTATTSTQSFSVEADTNTASNVGSTTATLNGTVDPNGITPLTGSFKYGTDPTLTSGTTVTATTPSGGTLGGLTDPTSISVNLTGLSANTTYYFEALGGGMATGSILSFTTAAIQAPPTASTTNATSIATSSATLNGTINPNLTSVTAIQFIYSTSPTLSSGTATTTLDDGAGAPLTAGGSSAQTFSTTTTTLTTGTTYYFKIRACTASSGSLPNITCSAFVDGGILSFTTTAGAAPSVTTNVATNVATSSITFNGAITATGGTNATQSGFTYGIDPTLATVIATSTLGGQTGTASFTATTTDLTASTTYYFRAYATNSGGTSYGSILSTTTTALPIAPSVTTNVPSSVTNSSIVFNGAIIATGGTNATQSGFAYGTDSTLATVVATSTLGGQTGTASFSTTTTGLSSNTTYYIRAYATNSAGTSYGATVSTTTLITIVSPSVTTNAATNVATSSMTLNGAITSTGGSDATQSGFAYGTSSTLTTVIATTTLGSQSGTASYTSSLTGLTASTTYYFRAYATNSGGTSYGSILSTTTALIIMSPSVTTNAPASITINSITLNGAITATGGSNAIESGFAYGTDSTLATVVATSTLGAQTGTVSFSTTTTGLSSNTIYYIRAYATNSAGTSYGAIVSTTTLTVILAPSVTTSAASSIIETGMTLNGNITSTGGENASQSGFAYGTDSTLATVIATSTLGGQGGAATLLSTLTGLTASTTYYFRAYATNSAGTGLGAIVSATTLQTPVTSAPTPTPTPGNGSPFIIGQPGPTSGVSSATSATSKGVPENFSGLVCQRYLKSYILPNTSNDPSEVKKLQQFLNESEGELLVVDGVYKETDIAAVKRFQKKYIDQVLIPWDISTPTGRVYKTTVAKINLMMCAKQVGCPYFTKYQKLGTVDNENVKIEDFLNIINAPINSYPSGGLSLTKTYTPQLKTAVENFQSTYKNIVLTPWGQSKPTGWWYQSTRHAANKLMNCSEGSLKLDNGATIQ